MTPAAPVSLPDEKNAQDRPVSAAVRRDLYRARNLAARRLPAMVEADATRWCPVCSRERPATEFYPDRTKASGFSSRCKACDNSRPRPSARRRPAGRCKRCDAPKPNAKRRYCDRCRDIQARERKRKSGSYRPKPRGWQAAKGYGVAHRQLRKAWAPRVAAGVVDCWRCGGRIEPGAPWDLGHDDEDRSKYRGPEHPRCNRQAAAKLQAAARQGAQSRAWW